ncbi:MAG: GNAT family N-acetyltransferase [Lachnospiraceae bacterium]
MKLNPVLREDEMILRLLKSEDIGPYYEAFFVNEDEEVSRFTATNQQFTREQVHDYLKRIENDPSRYDFLIEYGDKWVGEIVLNEITEDHHAGFRIALFHAQYCNQGIGQKAMKLLFDFAFHTLGVLDIELEVLTINSRARHVYEKFGFEVEEVLVEEYTYKDEVFDAYLMRLTKEKYEKAAVGRISNVFGLREHKV